MKYIVVVLFAVIAVQFSCSAPAPDDEKKDVPAVPVVAAAAENSPSPAAVAEVKSAAPESSPSPNPEVPAAVEEKKA
ncbi:unnamed protein product [Parnassius apollo]|uniref:(apollo) hypothetical protein n=1 Tax=Parnassius apollo TaxID=110799 RepID=A0A8S3X0E1_PARAO|nr:unnamed protein product [Parnassius apollo]